MIACRRYNSPVKTSPPDIITPMTKPITAQASAIPVEKSTIIKQPPPLDTHCRENYGVKFLLSQHRDIRRLKRQTESPSIHGNKFWGSSYLLMDYLQEHPLPSGCKVLELGCGWGLLGIHCAVAYQSETTGIDADDAVFPFLDLHAQHNGVNIETQQLRFEELDEDYLSQFDIMLGADICFWDELSEELMQLMDRAINAGIKKIVIADPERAPFFELAEYCIEAYYAELENRVIDKPRRASGCLLVIENE